MSVPEGDDRSPHDSASLSKKEPEETGSAFILHTPESIPPHELWIRGGAISSDPYDLENVFFHAARAAGFRVDLRRRIQNAKDIRIRDKIGRENIVYVQQVNLKNMRVWFADNSTQEQVRLLWDETQDDNRTALLRAVDRGDPSSIRNYFAAHSQGPLFAIDPTVVARMYVRAYSRMIDQQRELWRQQAEKYQATPYITEAALATHQANNVQIISDLERQFMQSSLYQTTTPLYEGFRSAGVKGISAEAMRKIYTSMIQDTMKSAQPQLTP